jgi:hypothetical protein
MMANDRELNLMKIFIYPRVIEVFLKLLAERGIVKSFKYQETIGYIIVATILVYFFIAEPSVLPPSYVKGVV